MALRNNVNQTRLELWKIVRPLEYFLVDIIIEKTIGWRQKEARIKIEELMEKTDQDHTRIYRALKALETKGIITRRKVDHNLIIGLNEEYFGGLLIQKHENALLARKSKIKMVVDNSKSTCKISTPIVRNQHISTAYGAQPLCVERTEKESEDFEIIEKPRSLNTLLKETHLKTSLKDSKSLGENGSSLTLLGGTGQRKQRTPEEQKRIVMEQVAAMKAEAV